MKLFVKVHGILNNMKNKVIKLELMSAYGTFKSEEFITFAKYAKSYKSPRNVEDAYKKWIKLK